MSGNPIADAGLKLYPMAEVQDLRERIILMNGMIVDAAEALTKGNASMKRARKAIEGLREILEELLDQANCHSDQCKRMYSRDEAQGLNGYCICAVDKAKTIIKEKK